MLRISLATFILGTGLLIAVPNMASAAGDEPGWLGIVVARGELKQRIESTPMVERPNRPFHFYGNTVRREYYRGNPLPRPDDLIKGGAAPDFQTLDLHAQYRLPRPRTSSSRGGLGTGSSGHDAQPRIVRRLPAPGAPAAARAGL